MEGVQPAAATPKSLEILCFDGTGNKFQGNASDSNIVKIFSLLDRQDGNQFHYYQPGIGTYVETSSLSHKSRFGRIKSWYVKSKDMAIGTSFGEHVMAGYKFLMRYYNQGDHLYFFGFSRGAYTARFLAQMLDFIGLLSAGNEEMLRFAWKTFAGWQMRAEGTEKDKEKRKEQFNFMKNFRQTFSRPIDRIRFIGLFDCVNSVPQFEAAWMGRTRFPYSAKSSALVIRHAVSIDERRAKFRQDLVSEQRRAPDDHAHVHGDHLHWHHKEALEGPSPNEKTDRPKLQSPPSEHHSRYSPKRQTSHLQPIASSAASQNDAASTAGSQISIDSTAAARERRQEHRDFDADYHDEHDEQDILELWFAGQHGDIGGGWTLKEGEQPASDLPLMWMVREAKRAGMPFDEDKLEASGYLVDNVLRHQETPAITIEGQPMPQPQRTASVNHSVVRNEEDMLRLETTTTVHDSLAFGKGMGAMSVLSWQVMEYLPFRRMDLHEDGSWKPISWPLPMGEPRDMPDTALVHGSVIRRMEADPSYRPGNLIIGGGGRGVKIAPKEAGIGHWRVAREAGDRLGEAVIRMPKQAV
ncbi:hypothetical protein BAUCODRAFT_148869 [Baudoinia panamericana UAMH 10762]|uniref:T6SS Phospholipase effector Tle1-like catalytic domain-containing protein n=1 Tax=Baudoinia panamericana (strain UAMH 10762) TaxID=717646 RepID=M2LNU6_BAUPA|nr:uncharacterized protein BAUCODRAFT_148869 [Baudoinia panamericana UAMH 10762]EMC96032.1 hypothetical protein BAUCODRAFT_148869 [Baudoinia panamericana UAMH 10762]